ncbi:unnamed protein product [Schistocephalus solidus]|uniref:Ion_trans domain-containing protein n=1 Tax=Schistocephalus solidus TaxID=70667 RepID=A0A183SZY2_SCHSO|nr:unnamed protein product [Schistocephalus solidus]
MVFLFIAFLCPLPFSSSTTTGWSPYDLGQLANLLIVLRALRFTQAFTRKPTIVTTLLQLPKHLAPVLGIFLSFYYIYALLGLNLFHGAIRYEEMLHAPNYTSERAMLTFECGTYQQLNYWSLNFDDFAASVFVLWSLMVTNNWHVIVRAFSDQLGRTRDKSPRLSHQAVLYLPSPSSFSSFSPSANTSLDYALGAMETEYLESTSLTLLSAGTSPLSDASFLFVQEARDREMRAQAVRLQGETAAEPPCLQGSTRHSRWLHCCWDCCCYNPAQASIITDSEELLPTAVLEISHHTPNAHSSTTTAAHETDEVYYPTSFSFAEMFRAEQQGRPLDAGAVDGFDGFEEVFHFIAVHIPLDSLSLVDHPGVLHLPQPLLYKAETSEEDDEAVIHPVTSIANRLGYQHVLWISPPAENIVHQLPRLRSRVHPRGRLPRQKVEEGVGQQETVFNSGSQKKEAVIVTTTENVRTQHSLSGSVVCLDAGIEVTKENQLICLLHSRQEAMEVLVEFVLHRIRASRWGGGVGADDVGKHVSPNRHAEAHQAIRRWPIADSADVSRCRSG